MSDAPDTQQARAALRRPRRVYRSRLDRYRAELVRAHRAGDSLAAMQRWLRATHRVRVERSTISRALARWPETGATDA